MVRPEAIEALKRTLSAAPPATRDVSKMEAVGQLRVQIAELVELRGYTLTQVSEMLAAGGVALSPNTLRSYLNRFERGRKKPTSKSDARPVSTSASSNKKATPPPPPPPDTPATTPALPAHSGEFIVRPDREKI